MRLGFDVDGVIYQWSPIVRKILAREYGITLEESTYWDYLKDNTPKEVWKDLWDKWIVEMYTNDAGWYPGAKEALRELSEENDLVLITATPKRVQAVRMRHLVDHFPTVSGIIFCPILSSDKTFVKCDLYLDDKPETTANSARSGALSLLMDRPWNQGYSFPCVDRVFSWKEVLDIVKGHQNE